MRGVNALDVKGRVGFGVAELLRLRQHGVKGQALVAHFRQDEVGSAVDDAGDPFDAVGREAFAQGLDDGHAAGDRGLEGHHHAFFLRRGEYFIAVGGEQRLVGGDNVLAVGDGFQHHVLGEGVAADQLDNDVDVRVGDDLVSVRRHFGLAAGDFFRPFDVLVGHLGNDDAATGAAGDFLLVARKYRPGAAAYGTDAKQAYVYWFHVLCLNIKGVMPERIRRGVCDNRRESAQCGRWLRSNRRYWAGRRGEDDPAAAS